MGLHKSTYLLIGVRLNEKDFDTDKLYDDELLPYVEGHAGVRTSIITSETGSFVHVGALLASDDHNDDVKSTPISLVLAGLTNNDDVADEIEADIRAIMTHLGLSVPENMVGILDLWFFTAVA